MNIQPMSITDTMVLKLFSEHDDFMIEFLGEDSHYYTRYTENENIENVWVVYEENLPAGCIAYRTKTDGVGEVKRLFIRNEYRGKGISKELLNLLEKHAREQGCTKLFLDTRITLEPAVSLYRAVGFEIIFQQGLYVQMEKQL
ncbi:MAG: GNAT family N-acetyltransferase [Lachnospiraceae bacterium]|nr:GNAT family N-acetyltransferase [Lachnospiraceae bacterium]